MAKQKDNDPKKQHYVPKHYLRFFCTNNSHQLWAYSKKLGKIFQSNINDVASRNYFYESRWLNSPTSDAFLQQGVVEKKLLGKAEKEQAPALRSIVKKLNLAITPCGCAPAFSEEEIDALRAFMALTLCRNPRTIGLFRPTAEDRASEPELLAIEEAIEMLGFGDYSAFEDQGIKRGLTSFVEGSLPSIILDQVQDLAINFAVACRGSIFVTSTHPVCYQVERNRLSYLYLPLTSRFAVFCSKMQDEMKLFDLSAKNVDSLNLIYADPGNEMADVVLSPSKTTLENLKFMVKAGRGLGDVCEIVGMPRKR